AVEARVIAAIGELIGGETEGNPEVGLVGRHAEGVGHDADDRVDLAAQRERGTDGVGASAEGAAPERFAHDGGALGAGLVFVGAKPTTGEWLNAEGGPEVVTELRAGDAFGFGRAEVVEILAAE